MKKLITSILIIMLLLQASIGVFALEVTNGAVEVETTAGNKETVDVTVSTDTSVEGVTSTSSVANNYVTESGMLVDYFGNRVVNTHKDGSTTETGYSEYSSVDYENAYYAEGGYEYEKEINIPILNVNIPLTDKDDDSTEKDETENIINGQSGVVAISGDEKESEDDDVYDYTEVTVTLPYQVSVKTNAVVVKEVINDEYKELEHIASAVRPDNGGTEIMHPTKKVTLPTNASEVPTISEGYEFVNLGISALSHYWAAVNYKSPDPDSSEVGYVYTDGTNTYYSHHKYAELRARDLALSGIYVNGKYIPAPAPEEGQKPMTAYFPAKYDTIQQFYLSDKEGNIATTYCVDQTTTAEHDFSYKIKNLADAGYYSKESEDMIRSIALNGYWGTSSGLGSLEELKAKLRATNNFSEAELAKLTDGVAMTATQYAIWSFSNHMDDVAFLNAYYRTKASGYPGKGNVFTAPKESSDVLFKLYEYLVNLEPTSLEKDMNNTIINEDNFIEEVNVQLFDKIETASENMDEDVNNDVYLSNVTFDLAVRPRSNSDSVFVTLVNEKDEILASGRVVGQLQNGEVYLEKNEEGQYVFKNIPLQEGTQKLSFYVSGHQYINQGVYLYNSEVKDGAKSQTMIGIASGNRNVNVKLSLDFGFSLEEQVKETRRFWRLERTISPVEDVLSGEKLFDGIAGEGFSFELSKNDEVLQTVSSDENGYFEFDKFVFDEPGTFTYVVSEKMGDDASVVYDKAQYIVNYTISADQGVLAIENKEIIKVVEDEEITSNSIIFNNYTVEPVSVHFEGTKMLDSEVASGFEFTLSYENEVIETVKSDENGKIVFADLTFDTIGEYKYTIAEVKGTDPSIKYDTTIYNVVVIITRDNDVLKADVVYKKGNSVVDGITFVNKTVPPVPPTADTSSALGYMISVLLSCAGIIVLSSQRRK